MLKSFNANACTFCLVRSGTEPWNLLENFTDTESSLKKGFVSGKYVLCCPSSDLFSNESTGVLISDKRRCWLSEVTLGLNKWSNGGTDKGAAITGSRLDVGGSNGNILIRLYARARWCSENRRWGLWRYSDLILRRRIPRSQPWGSAQSCWWCWNMGWLL